jgi:hypothetical protein
VVGAFDLRRASRDEVRASEVTEMKAMTDEHETRSDYHMAMRDLFRRGVERGRLSLREIRAALPPAHTSTTELEVVLYSLEALGVAVTE